MSTCLRSCLITLFGLGLATALGAAPACASDAYPTRPIVMVVPFAAGGGSDNLARILAGGMSEELGQPVVVENKPGGSTTIAAGFVARAQPDGYTMLLGSLTTFVVNPLLEVKSSYTLDDLSLVGMVASFPMAYVVPSSSPFQSMAELVENVKSAPPGTHSYASPGVGSPHHLGMEALKYRAGIDLVHVPYRGISPAIPDLMSGRVTAMLVDYAAVAGLIKDGRLRPLALGSAEPTAFLPEVPTMRSLGYDDFQIAGLQGLAVPAGVPADVLGKLVAALRDTMADDAIQARLRDIGLDPEFLDPAAFAQRLTQERKELGTVIKANNITLE
ncbi:tripartite tricarboxylate transporter substrate binding protein [Verticiella sediminum]|uniref:Tripartite tricarboxylate transporter substrate binding protein n=1 Tax=Verticiella sediminum TaxID=1247510 RepID=A0A556ALU0_9BURK|nr:tripartite tricarboxylate transporter substrate binding protein [Verticiella sediminum]TSH93859.1 tripartite tricarboxylate transporter substrate binding protein [Verticiella sediminum]